MQRFYYNLLFSLCHAKQGSLPRRREEVLKTRSMHLTSAVCAPILMWPKNVISCDDNDDDDDVDDIFATGPLK